MKLSLNDLVACLACLAAACHAGRSASDRFDDGAAPTTDLSEGAASRAAGPASARLDPIEDSRPATLQIEEVLGWLLVVHDNEISPARQAQAESISPDAANFAMASFEQHAEDKHALKALAIELGADPLENDRAKALREKGSRELAELLRLDGYEFERAYLGARVEALDQSLRLIDGRLIPAAGNDLLRKQLATVRGHVAEQLAAARKLDPQPKL